MGNCNFMSKKLLTCISLVLLLSMSACQNNADETPIGPTATLHPLFNSQGLSTPTPRPTTQPTLAQPTHESPPALDEIEFIVAPIFVDKLSPDWSLENSSRMEYEVVTNTELLGDAPALRIQATDAEAVAYFSLNESAAGRYPRSAVFGLAFSLNPGEDWIRGRDVGITIIGSNANDYWVPGDTSVDSPFNLDPIFSETGLHFLGVDGSIPPQNWVPFEVYLDNLVFDPIYENVVALYFKLAPGLRTPVYLNNIQLLLLPEELREETP